MKFGIAGLSFLFVTMMAAPASAVDCEPAVKFLDHVRAQVSYDKENDICSINLSPIRRGLVSRSFLFDSNGQFTVQNNLLDSRGRRKLGYRSYHFFPRTSAPSVHFFRARSLMWIITSGLEVFFDSHTLRIISSNGVEIDEDPQINDRNQGGVEILSQKAVVLDSGYSEALPAQFNPDEASIFSDIKGKSCAVDNREIYQYSTEKRADGSDRVKHVQFRFAPQQGKDIRLASFLAGRCPDLDLSPLQ